MRCENVLCMYWCEGACMLCEVQLDFQGVCTTARYPEDEKEIIERYYRIMEQREENKKPPSRL